MELEGYQAKLEVATQSTEAAAEMMVWAKRFAETTPFEMSSVVDAATRLELYGLSAKKWLPLVGDMAGAMGKDVTQAVEAIADAVSGGGLERLKEFGVTSVKLQAAGWTGSYVDEEGIATLTAALEQIMGTQFAGGMAKLMDTATGALSNFQDAVFNVRAALGDALLPALKTIMPIITSFASHLAERLRELGPVLTEWITTKLGALIGWVQSSGPQVLALARSLGEWLWKAGQAGWQALTWLVDKAREVGTVFMETVWPAIVNFATMVRDVLVPILVQQFGGSADYARGTIQALADMVARYLDAMTANLPSIAQKFSEFVSTWKDSFLPVIDRLVNELLPQFLEIGIAIVPVMLALSNAIMPVIDLIGAIAGGALDQITRITEPLSKGQYGQALWEGIKNPWNAFAVDAPGVFDEVYGGMKDRHAARQRWDAAQRNMPTVNNNIYLDGRRVAQTVNNQNQIASRECSRF
jgi:phage-related protein